NERRRDRRPGVAMKILIVDDDRNIRSLLVDFFTPRGHDVRSSSNGQEALVVMEKELIDLVISDIRMPVMDGAALRREIRKRHPKARVALMTGYYRDPEQAISLGADYFIEKPFSMSQILSIVDGS